ncbi:rho guanine nucleotide exchange factor 7 isoform X9 [Panthera onca]|uniref:rho guanine nucleotide exchange factor 7 isoform X10 n=1 Tax=Panthera onca TaxID=9690 RepID=UPI000904A452|nr:rho guanine nucleotide exchange factor 7 isoform X10 [Panthera onca]
MKRHLTVGQDAREGARAGRTAAPPEPIAGPASPWASRRGRGAQPAGPRPLRGERRPDGLAARGGRARRRYEFRRADRYVAHHLGGAGVAQENHLGPGGLPAGVSEGWGGPLQAAGAPAPRDHRESLPGAPERERVPEQYPRVPARLRGLPAAGDIGLGSDSVCARPSSHRIKSFDSLGAQPSHSRTSKLFQGQYRSLDMTDNSNSQLVVRAKFNFQQTNEDELSFTKGDIIHVTRVEEGGWWEGTHNGRTGWFPSNYVREVKPSEKPVSPKSGTLKSPPKGFDTTAINKSYYNVVLQNILETENEYSKELQTVLSTYLRPLQTSEKLSSANISYLMGNLEEICSFQQMLVQSLEECTKLPEAQQRVGGCFLNLMPQMKTLYLAYCANHPSAVNVLTEHSEQLGEFMETRGASSPGILVLTTGLSRPFMRLDKYPTLLKELERHMEDYHPDRQDIQKSMTAFKNLSAQCQEVRKRKELELQILTEAIRSWEGDDITTLGSVVYMSQVMVQCAGSEEKNERYLLLFPNSLLMLSASPRMSGFIYQGKLPTTGMTITKLEDSENHRNAFEISGSMIERILVSCNNQQDLHEWVDHLQKQTKVTSVGNPTIKPHSVPSHTDLSKSPKTMKKLLPKRKPERKPSDEEFALRKSSRKESAPQVLLPEEEKIIVEETKSNGQTVIEEKSLVDTVYALKDEVQELRQDNKKMKKSLEEEQRARKDLEKLVRKVLKNMNDPAWDETNL